MPAYEHLLYERTDGVLLITLNRPEKLNAWGFQMESEFLQALDEANADSEVRSIVVTGAGRAFCAGGDISGWSQDLLSRAEGRVASPLTSREGSPDVPIALS